MTVRDLIAILESFDGDLVVCRADNEDIDTEITEVELATELRWPATGPRATVTTVRIS